MKTHTQLLATALPLAALAVGTFATVGSATTASKAPVGVVSSGPQPQAAFEWTDAAMKAAKPMDITLKGSPKPAAASVLKVTGKPGLIAGQAGPDGAAIAAAAQSASVAPSSATPTPMSGGFTYPTPFTRYEVELGVRKYAGNAAVGKHFFKQNGLSYVCSASAISPTAIWTAGHCSSDGAGHFSTNVIFVPAYRDGTKPYGQFVCNSLVTSSAWHFSGDLRYDYAKANCGLNAKGQNFAATTGWLGFAWNWGYGFHYDDFGFPQAAPFNGARMQRCESSFGHADTRMAAPQPQAIGCDMTGGSSGGPWIWQFGTGNYVNGENSYKYTTPAEPLEMYSPFYGDNALAVFNG